MSALLTPVNGNGTAEAVSRRVRWSEMTQLPGNPINPRRIAKMEAEGFDPSAAGTPELALNDHPAFPDLPEDTIVIIDGNHRHVVAMVAGRGDDEHICKVSRGLTREQIARRFLQVNDYRQHRANELFVWRVVAGERKAVEINEIVESAGWHVPTHAGGQRNGGIMATAALEWVYDGAPQFKDKYAGRQATALRRTLEGVSAMYGTGSKVPSGNLIRGLGLFHLRYGEKVNMEQLHDRVTEKLPTPKRLIQATEVQKETWNCTVAEAYARTFQRYYNGTRRSKRNLADW